MLSDLVERLRAAIDGGTGPIAIDADGVEALLDDRAALAAEVERLRAAVATAWDSAAALSQTVRLHTPEQWIGGPIGDAVEELVNAIAAAEPRPAGDATAADDAKGG